MAYETLTFDIENGIGIIRLNQPEARNALNVQMRVELGDVIGRLRSERTTKAVVLTGNGGGVLRRRRSAVAGRRGVEHARCA
jgi:2-(1,2-epoxy-1,2-dihydrophenyl)acetyl-CoA isomerase